ncbi:hypothetical protein MMYC01_206756, partial [Madurella mycetomatis]
MPAAWSSQLSTLDLGYDVFVTLSMVGWVIPGVEDFYRKRIKRAADLLNRHMSIGFTIPFMMICRSPFTDARSVGAVALCFVLTGVFNIVSTYAIALPLQCLMVRWAKEFWNGESSDMERAKSENGSKLRTPVKSPCEGFSVDSFPAISLYLPGEESSSEGGSSPPQFLCHSIGRITPLHRAQLLNWTLHNLSLLLSDIPFSTSLLFSIWLTTLALQTGLKSHPRLSPWLRTLLSGLSNPVLWTSLAMMSYLLLDGIISNRPFQEMFDMLQTHTPLSNLILLSSTEPTSDGPVAGMAAGDVAISILNSGLVAWGLKLYEYRRQLLSRAGLTVLSVSALLALGNV